MTKADYIHLFKEACGGKCNAEYNPCAFRQAADSLAALKPVAVRSKSLTKYMEFTNIDAWQSEIPKSASLLYALDEADNEST